MPVKLQNHSADEHEARIEIIPLIDIMFFLLASFMLVSLSMVTLKSVKVNLPTATAGTGESKRGIVDVSVNQVGLVFLDKQRVADDALVRKLSAARHANADLKVFISGDRDAKHGQIIHVLDLVRAAGIDKVAFQINPPQESVSQ
jgi:biopolymer transport protein ExbD